MHISRTSTFNFFKFKFKKILKWTTIESSTNRSWSSIRMGSQHCLPILGKEALPDEILRNGNAKGGNFEWIRIAPKMQSLTSQRAPPLDDMRMKFTTTASHFCHLKNPTRRDRGSAACSHTPPSEMDNAVWKGTKFRHNVRGTLRESIRRMRSLSLDLARSSRNHNNEVRRPF